MPDGNDAGLKLTLTQQRLYQALIERNAPTSASGTEQRSPSSTTMSYRTVCPSPLMHCARSWKNFPATASASTEEQTYRRGYAISSPHGRGPDPPNFILLLLAEHNRWLQFTHGLGCSFFRRSRNRLFNSGARALNVLCPGEVRQPLYDGLARCLMLSQGPFNGRGP
jgi:hypothetical protein